MSKVLNDPEEVARFIARRSWLERFERECIRWGVSRSQVIVDAVTRFALGPRGLREMYGRRSISSPRGAGKTAGE